MEDQGYVWEVSALSSSRRLPPSKESTDIVAVDFALTETAYTIVRLIQRFPVIQLPPGELVELTGVEKQTMTLVMFIAEGCKVELRS